MMGGIGISWTMCKLFASRSRQTKMPVPHHSFFTGWMPSCRQTNSINALKDLKGKTRKAKPIWIYWSKQTVSGSGISWAICKSAP